MAENSQKSAAEKAIEVLLAAPGELGDIAQSVLPKLVEAGRIELSSLNMTERLNAAKLVGRLAFKEAQAEFERMNAKEAFGDDNNVVVHLPDASPPRLIRSNPTAGPGAEALAVPDYDSLSAQQVLPRLNALDAAELEAVRIYEDEHRGRRTVLSRIAELQASPE